MWDLPGPGIEPVSPALAGGFLTTAPPRKSPKVVASICPPICSKVTSLDLSFPCISYVKLENWTRVFLRSLLVLTFYESVIKEPWISSTWGCASLRQHLSCEGERRMQPLLGMRPPNIPGCLLTLVLGDFTGSPAVKTPRFQCRGPGFDPWSGN